MYKVLVKRQLTAALTVLVFFICVLFVMTETKEHHHLNQLDGYQTKYIEEHYNGDRDAFFTEFRVNYEAADERVKAIENFWLYEGERPDVLLEPVQQAAGGQVVNIEMVKWRSDMLAMPGIYGETVAGDQFLFMQLERRLKAQERFDINLLSNMEMMRRSIKRGEKETSIYHAKVPFYETALAQYEKVDTDFELADTYYVKEVFDYAEGDCYILILIAVIVFSTFSDCAQSKVSNKILVSRLGVRKYALTQIGATFTVVALCLCFYFAASFFILTSGNRFSEAWSLPVQAVVGFENVPLAVSAGTFLLIHHGMKAVFCLMITALLLLLSMLSYNNIMSVMLSAGAVGALMMLYNSQIGAVRTNDLFGTETPLTPLFIGGTKYLFRDMPYVMIGSKVFHYALLAGVAMITVTALLTVLTVLVSKPVMKWRAAR